MNQGCLKLYAIVLLLVGAVLALVGLVYLAAPNASKLSAIIILAVGLIVIGFAASRLRALRSEAPEGVEQQLTALGAAAGGEVTVALAAGETGLDDMSVRLGLERLLQKGLVKLEHREGTEYYIFAGVKQQKMIKKCPYCGNEYPLAQAGRTCPSCGGNLDIVPE